MTTPEKLKVLILDDEIQFTNELNDLFISLDFDSYQANTIEEGRKILSDHEIDILFLDLRLPGINGLEILKEARLQYPLTEVIIVSAHVDMDTINSAMKLGAFDYLRKPFRYIDVQIILERTLRYIGVQRRLKQTSERNSAISRYIDETIDRNFIGTSPQIMEVFDNATLASKEPDKNVLITGEYGTGKKNIARIIHSSSLRKDFIFCAVNNSASSESDLGKEFLGYRNSLIPDTSNDIMGYFDLCNGGTIFLEEIADLPLTFQEILLSAIKEKTIVRENETKLIHTDFRIISATTFNIEDLIVQKKFNPDLFHELNTIHIHVPALRERPEDIKPLLLYFIKCYSKEFKKNNIRIADEVFDTIQHYDFPGNVRELRNLAERAVILCKGDILTTTDFHL